MTNKQARFLTHLRMPISKARDIARKKGRICLRCLDRPVHRGKRCKNCIEQRIKENKNRKR